MTLPVSYIPGITEGNEGKVLAKAFTVVSAEAENPRKPQNYIPAVSGEYRLQRAKNDGLQPAVIQSY